jgi:hypothetical protein
LEYYAEVDLKADDDLSTDLHNGKIMKPLKYRRELFLILRVSGGLPDVAPGSFFQKDLTKYEICTPLPPLYIL